MVFVKRFESAALPHPRLAPTARVGGKAINGAGKGCKIPISEPVPGAQSHSALPREREKPPGSAELRGNAAEPQAGTGVGAAAGPAAAPPSECHIGGCATAESGAGSLADAEIRLKSRRGPSERQPGTPAARALRQEGRGRLSSGRNAPSPGCGSVYRPPPLPRPSVVHTAGQSAAAAVFPDGLWMRRHRTGSVSGDVIQFDATAPPAVPHAQGQHRRLGMLS